jgi:hypothetical protein
LGSVQFANRAPSWGRTSLAFGGSATEYAHSSIAAANPAAARRAAARRAARVVQRASCSARRATRSVQHAACNTQREACQPAPHTQADGPCPTSAPGLGSPQSHLRRDCLWPRHRAPPRDRREATRSRATAERRRTQSTAAERRFDSAVGGGQRRVSRKPRRPKRAVALLVGSDRS